MPETPDFSIVIPTKARPELLARAIGSVLAQTGAGFELIAIDDGAGEGLAVAASFRDARITAVSSGSAGQVGSRNLGVSRAIGRWITFLDDDDWWEGTGHLAALAAALGEGEALAFGSGEMVMAGGGPAIAFSAAADWRSIRRDNTILVSSMAYPASLHARLGAFDAGLPFYWDWDWYLRLAEARVPFVSATTRAARITAHPGSVSSAAFEAARRANLDALEHKHGLGPIALKNHLVIAQEQQGTPQE